MEPEQKAMMDVTASVFDLLDVYIEQCLGHRNAENALIDAYFAFWSGLKKRVGTSSGFSGLSEYLFFRYILRSLERRTSESFIPEEITKYTYVFRSNSLVLTHDVDIASFVNVNKQRTDIAVFSAEGNGSYRLLASFEIKVYISDRHVLEKTLERFDHLAQHTAALLFPVVFGGQYRNELNHFCAKHQGRVFVISKEAFEFRISLDQAIDKILSKIRQGSS